MSGYNDLAIVVKRTNYQEADRIIKLYTAKKGMISALAKGVRKQKSKIASAVEPFCLSEVRYISSKSQLVTITSASVKKYYESIMNDLEKQLIAAEALKLVDRYVEDSGHGDYFDLLNAYFDHLNEMNSNELCQLWWQLNFLDLTGHRFNLHLELNGSTLTKDRKYNFDYDSGSFFSSSQGMYDSNHIQLLRLVLANQPDKLLKLKNVSSYSSDLLPLTKKFLSYTFG